MNPLELSHLYVIGRSLSEKDGENYIEHISHVSISFAHYDEQKAYWVVGVEGCSSCGFGYGDRFSDSWPSRRLRKLDSIEKDLFCTDEIIRASAAQLIRFIEEYTETQSMKDWNSL